LVGPAAILVLVLIGLAIWWFNRPAPIPTRPPATAPAVGTCWQLEHSAAQQAFPWPGSPVACTEKHTVEVSYVGQVDHVLIDKDRSSTGNDLKVADNLMYAEARRACAGVAATYLGGDWHRARVGLIADWIDPAHDGFFGCAIAQVADPGGGSFVSRTASLKGAGVNGPLAVDCVSRGSGSSLAYTTCTQPHNGEFVGTYTVTPANAPFNADGVTRAVKKGCSDAALAYLGLTAGATRDDLSVGYVGPTAAETWLGSDQTFACYAMANVTLTGTIRDLGTRPLPH
jgi:hypothetical protein